MMKYKEKVDNHLEQSREQLEKILDMVNVNSINKEELNRYVNNVINKLEHCSNLVDLEEG